MRQPGIKSKPVVQGSILQGGRYNLSNEKKKNTAGVILICLYYNLKN